MSLADPPFTTSLSVRQGLDTPPLPVGCRWPFAASTNLKPAVPTVMVHGDERSVPSESRTVIVGVTVPAGGFGQLTSPVAASMVIPAGALPSVNVNGYAPPTTTARML